MRFALPSLLVVSLLCVDSALAAQRADASVLSFDAIFSAAVKKLSSSNRQKLAQDIRVPLPKLLSATGIHKRGAKAIGARLVENDDEEVDHLERRQTNLPCTPLTPNSGTSPPGLVNLAKCTRDVPTEKIDDPVLGLQVGTINNWADGHIPPSLRGIFYTEGNPYPTECFSTGTAIWNASSNTFDIPLYAAKTWSWDPNYFGNDFGRTYVGEGWTYKATCRPNDQGLQFCNIALWNRRTETYSYNTTVFAIETTTPNEYNRVTLLGGGLSGASYNYTLRRIVDENGNRTSQFTQRFLANKNQIIGTQGSFFVHLGNTIQVPFLS